MVLLILERVPASLRGELSRWMIEPKTGVFVGTLSALVRDKLWERVDGNPRVGGAILIYRANTEQGFAVRCSGSPDRAVVNHEGLMLVRLSSAPRGGQPGKRGEQKGGSAEKPNR